MPIISNFPALGGYEWATISTVSGGAGTSATGVYCVTSEDGHPIAVELSGQQ